MKTKFIKAGHIVLSIDLPPNFMEVCKQCKVEPEKAIKKYLSLLGVDVLLEQYYHRDQVHAGHLFQLLVGSIGGVYSEKDFRKRRLTNHYRFLLSRLQHEKRHNELHFKTSLTLISEWYHKLKRIKS